MTRRRKILIGVAAALFVANAIALVLKPQAEEALWFSWPYAEVPGEESHKRLEEFAGEMVHLDRNGARADGRRVPYSAMIGNVGRAEYASYVHMCSYWECPNTPWQAQAFALPDAPVSVVIAAYNAVRAACKSEVIVMTAFDPNFTKFGDNVFLGASFSLSIAPLDNSGDGKLDTLADGNLSLTRLEGRALDRLGEESGCARISPLRP